MYECNKIFNSLRKKGFFKKNSYSPKKDRSNKD